MDFIHPQYGVEATSFNLHNNNTGIMPAGRYYGFDRITAGTGGSPPVNHIEVDIKHDVTGIKPTLSDNLLSSQHYGAWVSKHGAKITVTDSVKIYVPYNGSGANITWYLVGTFTWSTILNGTPPTYELLSSAPSAANQILLGTITANMGAQDITGLTFKPSKHASFLDSDKDVQGLGIQSGSGYPGYNVSTGILYLPVGDKFRLYIESDPWVVNDIVFLNHEYHQPITLYIDAPTSNPTPYCGFKSTTSHGNFELPAGLTGQGQSNGGIYSLKAPEAMLVQKFETTGNWFLLNGHKKESFSSNGNSYITSVRNMLQYVLDSFGNSWTTPGLGSNVTPSSPDGLKIIYNPIMKCIQVKGKVQPISGTIPVEGQIFRIPSTYPIPLQTPIQVWGKPSGGSAGIVNLTRGWDAVNSTYGYYLESPDTYDWIEFAMTLVPLESY